MWLLFRCVVWDSNWNLVCCNATHPPKKKNGYFKAPLRLNPQSRSTAFRTYLIFLSPLPGIPRNTIFRNSSNGPHSSNAPFRNSNALSPRPPSQVYIPIYMYIHPYMVFCTYHRVLQVSAPVRLFGDTVFSADLFFFMNNSLAQSIWSVYGYRPFSVLAPDHALRVCTPFCSLAT